MKIIRKTLVILTVLFSMLVVSTTVAKPTSDFKIYQVLHTFPRFYAQDMEEESESRDPRLGKLSVAVAKAAEKHRPTGVSERNMQAALMTIAYKETRLAKNVAIGRCDLMPEGQRCDSGRAKTYFQLWATACPAVWEEDIVSDSQQELDVAAECAARLLTSAYNRCAGKNDHGYWAGAFSGYRSANCNWSPKQEHQSPKSRADFMRKVYWKLSNVSAPVASNEDSDKSS